MKFSLSETGIDGAKIAGFGAAVTRGSTQKTFKAVRDIMALVQFGPRTGNPVYVEKYADALHTVIYEKCPSGVLTGMVSFRESRSYGPVSGEVVRVKGYCALQPGIFLKEEKTEYPSNG